ncbi:MAG: hypothetical protein K9H84_06440 [Bacteroidales bacterium]|nr:hypothetical protein [Bacteroidales bacterium]
MAKQRIRKKQTAHDRKVQREANKLKKQGWNVQADLPKHAKPEPIGKKNRIPDILATKSGVKKIIEIETPETDKKHKDQQGTFRRSAGQQSRTTFQKILTKSKNG